MKILNHHKIYQKVQRIAIEIVERNYEETELFLLGINNNGMAFAQMLAKRLQEISPLTIHLHNIRLSPADPLANPINIDLEVNELNGKVVVLVDDVSNTGRTLHYATKPLLETLPKKIEVAILVDRTHKTFPIQADYVGLALATTLKENIDVHIREVEEFAVYLN